MPTVIDDLAIGEATACAHRPLWCHAHRRLECAAAECHHRALGGGLCPRYEAGLELICRHCPTGRGWVTDDVAVA